MKAKNENSLSVRTYAREGKEHSRRSCKKSACFARKSGCFRKYKRVIRQACSSVLSARWVLAASQCGGGAPSVVGEPPRREDNLLLRRGDEIAENRCVAARLSRLEARHGKSPEEGRIAHRSPNWKIRVNGFAIYTVQKMARIVKK